MNKNMANIFSKIKGGFRKFFGKVKESFKAAFNKEYWSYSFSKYKAFTALQAKEVFTRDKKLTKMSEKVAAIVSPILRFFIVAIISYVVMLLLTTFGVFDKSLIYYVIVFFSAIVFIFQLLGSISSCTNSYYIAEDNKVLITFPSSGATLFLSKLTIEFLKELKNTVGLYFPAVFGMVLYGATLNQVTTFSFGSVIWCVLPCVLWTAVIVLLGSLISTIWLQYLRVTKKIPAIRAIVLIAIAAAAVYLAVFLIGLIPENIDLLNVWQNLVEEINGFIYKVADYVIPIDWFCSSICGVGAPYKPYKLTGASFGRFFILLAIVVGLFVIAFLVIKPLFLHMMTKSVDYEKVSENSNKQNHMHHRHSTFAFKELKISFRTIEISGTYIVTYIAIPVLIFLLCKIFDAISTSVKGNMLVTMFQVLLITLPLLASNTSLASAYSREGRAGYIKKTKPIKPYTPMISKLLFNLILSIPSIFASMFIVGKFGKIDLASIALIGVSILLLQYAHIFYTATLDFTNPKNEAYATEGQNIKNTNERTSTIVGFVMSFLFSFVVFIFFNEAANKSMIFNASYFIEAAIRLVIISVLIFGACLLLYILKLKAYFVEK